MLAKITTKSNINCASSKYYIVHTDYTGIIYTIYRHITPPLLTPLWKSINNGYIFILAFSRAFSILFHRKSTVTNRNCGKPMYYLVS